jgi:hypothetical protein
MSLTTRRAARPVVFALVLLAAAGCDNAATLDPAGGPLQAVAFAGGVPIGTFGQPNSEFGDRYNGAQRNILPADLLASLVAIQARGGKVLLSIAGGPNQYKDADGHFSFPLWQSRVNRYEGIDFSAYIADGTLIGHYLVDEPNDPNNWGGVPIPGEMVEAMAEYSKQLWPDLPTVVRGEPAYLAKAGIAYHYLDAAWAQYVTRKGEPADYLQRNVTDAQSLGLELVVGLNILAGGTGGVPLTAAQVRDWGTVLLSSSYPCAFLSWKYDAAYLASAEMGSAMDDLRSQAQSRPTKSCRSAGASPPPPDPDPLATTTTIQSDSPDPSAAGQGVTISVAVSAAGSTPTGSVTVTAGGGGPSCTATLTGGAGSCVLTLASAGDLTLTAAYAGNATFASSSDTESHTVQGSPADVVITWAEPQDITYGTALGSGQLDATAASGGQSVAGSFTYLPAAGTVLDAGEDQELKATFTPSNSSAYKSATASVRLDVLRAAPTLAWSVPASTTVGPLSAGLLNATASGAGGAAVLGTFTYSPAAGTFLDAAPSRTLSVTFQPSSANYTTASRSVSLAVLYPWSGFFEPTNNPQVLNTAKAGTAIPVRFSLGGNRPAPVLATGSPEITAVTCPKWTNDAIEETVSASASSLQYENATGWYVYTWKTQTSWTNRCRRFRLVLKDGTSREAIFRFIR